MPLLSAYIVPHPPLIVPAIGKGEESKIAKTVESYEEVARRIGRLRPDTIVLVSPHSILYADYFHLSPGAGAEGDFGQFRAPGERFSVKYDQTLSAAIAAAAGRAGIPAGGLGEKNRRLDHGTMVPLHFVNRQDQDYELVRISVSGLPPLVHYRFGKCLAEAILNSGKRVVLIASGDLSHKLKSDGPYGYATEGPAFDRSITEAMASADFGRFLMFDEDFCEAAGECGLRSFTIMAGALDGLRIKSELLSYEGPFGVGYAVAAYDVLGEDGSRRFDLSYERGRSEQLAERRENEDAHVRLARETLEHYVMHRRRIARPAGLSAELTDRRAGVFVSLKLDGRLRGCIGTIAATTGCVADEIIQNAVSAGTRDPRFEPVRADELARLVYSVDVLGDAEPVGSVAGLDPKRYGVIVRKGIKSGLLLPNLEGVDSVEDQVSIALQKGGIDPEESYAIERFEVVRHH